MIISLRTMRVYIQGYVMPAGDEMVHMLVCLVHVSNAMYGLCIDVPVQLTNAKLSEVN